MSCHPAAHKFIGEDSKWEYLPLGTVASFLDEQRKPIKEEDRAKRRGSYPYYGASGIIDYVDDYLFNEDLVLLGEDGANIVTRSLPLAFTASGKIWVNNHAHVIRADTSKMSHKFLAYYLESLDYSKYNTGTAQPKLNKEVCSSIKVAVPPLPEQRKIAEILSCWDEGITTLSDLISKNNKRLNWMTQSLLFGRIRASRFIKGNGFQQIRSVSVPSDWKVCKILDVAEEVGLRNSENKSLTVLSCTKHRGLVPSLEYFGKQIFSSDISKYKRVPRSHFAYATNHIEEGSIGYQDAYDDALISPIYSVFKTKTHVDDRFLFYILKTETYRQFFQIATSASVDRRGSLRWNEFSQLPIALPSLEEQRLIAEVILTQKQELALCESQLRKYRAEKQALMQKLLTGKIRVKV